MPLYDYRCQDCRIAFTVEKSMTDDSQPVCTECGSDKASRIWNAFIMSGGNTQDVGQGASQSSSTKKGGGCGSCSSHSCGTCH
jgi:putative FmdB family regulatory protein